MAAYLLYSGTFTSTQGVPYRVEILKISDGIRPVPQEITFAYPDPAKIEWNDTDKLEPVQGSCLTLTLNSDTDRRFLDLYTVEVGTIRADIYRGDTLYWSGMLDPELYEEPFSSKQNYNVSVSFSDFAILDRKQWERRGMMRLDEVIDTCIQGTGIHYNGLVTRIGTWFLGVPTPSQGHSLLEYIWINCDNFFDEDDEPMTLREVLDETLRPFALRMVQKGGQIHLYDLHSLHGTDAQTVVWSDTDAMLDTDNVYNNVSVTFSPYADGVLYKGKLEHKEVLKEHPIGSSGEMIRTDWKGNDGFRIVYGPDPKLKMPFTLHNGACLYRIDPEYSGQEEAGVFWGMRLDDNVWRPNAPGPVDARNPVPIITTQRRALSTAAASGHQLRIKLETLFDVRYNPFEPMGIENEKGNWERLNDWANYAYVPIALNLYASDDPNAEVLYHFENTAVKNGIGYTHTKNNFKWVEGPADGIRAWLCYYDRSNRQSASGLGGWKTNRPIIGWYPGELPSKTSALSDGEYIPMPPVRGSLQLVVYAGISQYDNSGWEEKRDIFSRARWLMYKNPEIEIVRENGRDIEQEDVEESAWINPAAKETLRIETILGTLDKPVPSARGLLFDEKGSTYTRFTRGGHYEQLERLLIGTAYSQYATRKHMLSGTVELLPSFGPLADSTAPAPGDNTTGRKYVLLSEYQNLLRDESEIEMAEFDADNYDSLEIK